MKPDLQIQWMKNMCIRCTCGDTWAEFGFDLGGGEKEIPLERKAANSSPDMTPRIAEEFRTAIVEFLKDRGYTVINA